MKPFGQPLHLVAADFELTYNVIVYWCFGARPKTMRILSNKIINETENICIDKTVPVTLLIHPPHVNL
jgi:hypothetical protein